MPGSDVGGLWGPAGAFIVIPVDLTGLEVGIEPLAAALLARMTLAYPDRTDHQPTPLRGDGFEGLRLEYRRDVDGSEYEYVIHTLKTPTHGILHAAWRLAESDLPVEQLQHVLDAIVLEPASAHPDPADALPPHQSNAQALILNDIGLWYHERAAYDRSRALFEAASARGSVDPVIFTNWLSALDASGRADSALEALDDAAEQFSDDLSVQSWRPFLLQHTGRTDEAIQVYSELFDRGYRNEEDLLLYARLLRESGRPAESLGVIDEFYGDRTRSFAIVAELVAAHYEMDQEDRVIELCNAMLDAGRRDADLQFWKGRSEYALGWFREARNSLEAALAQDAGHAAARGLLDQVVALLGEGDNALLREPVEPVPIPANLADAGAADGCDSADLGACYLQRVTAVEHGAAGYRVTDLRRLRVDDRKGVTMFKTIRIPFDPLLETIHVGRLRVLDQSGRELATGALDEYYVLDDTSAGIVSQNKIAHLPVPGLEPGSIIEMQLSRRWSSRPDGLPFRAHGFSGPLPVARSALVLRGDIQRVSHKSHLVDEPESREGMLIWRVDNPPLQRFEQFSDAPERYLPTLWLADAAATWAGVGSDYLDDIRDVLEPDPELMRIAGEIVPGEAREIDVVRAIASHVQELLSYEAIEFGRRAWHPNPPKQIVAKRSGDCKDHALLLYHLLRERGVQANLALARVGGDVQPELPSLDQFDHMVVHLPGLNRFVDPTDKNYGIVDLPPMGLGDTWALVLEADAARLERIEPYPAPGSEIDSSRQLWLEGDGNLRVREALTLTDYAAAWMRYPLRRMSAADAKLWVQARMSDFHSVVELQSLEVENLETPSKPLKLEMEYVLFDLFVPDDGRMSGKLPAIWERLHLEAPPLDERFSPFALRYPFQVRSRVRAEAPDGVRLARGSEMTQSGNGPFASWAVRTQRDERAVTVEFDLVRKAGRHSAEAYPDYVEAMNGPLAQLRQGVVFSTP